MYYKIYFCVEIELPMSFVYRENFTSADWSHINSFA